MSERKGQPKPGTVCRYVHDNYGEGICIVLGTTRDYGGHQSYRTNIAINWIVPVPNLNFRTMHPQFDYDAGEPKYFWRCATVLTEAPLE